MSLYILFSTDRPVEEPTFGSAKNNMIFKIDSEEVGTFNLQMVESGGDAFIYNFLVYANSSMRMDSHTLTIQNGRPGGPASLMMLDYIVYS